MTIVNINDTQAQPVDMQGASQVTRRVPIGMAEGSPTMSFRVFTLEPGGHTPHHTHNWEHVNYVISGQGVLLDGEGKERPLQAGDFALVPAGETHQYRNRSDSKPFMMICAVPREHE